MDAPPWAGSHDAVQDNNRNPSIPTLASTIPHLPSTTVGIGLSRSTHYLCIAAGCFPKPVSLGGRAVGQVKSEVNARLTGPLKALETQTTSAAVVTAAANGPAGPEGRLVHRAPEQLRLHPAYLDVCGPVTAVRTLRAAVKSSLVIAPLLTTRDGLILDGHTRWQLARQEGRPSVVCIEYDLTDEQALLFMLDRYRHAEWLNDFCRIVMALQLEPHWRSRARERQRQGGTGKLSSTLTKADAINVRVEIARAAGVCTGNVTKVKQLLKTATPAVRDALRRGEISIHRAWQWHQLGPDKQNARLDQYRSRKDIHHTIRHLLRKHRDEQDKVFTIEQLAARLAGPARGRLAHATLRVVDLPGPALIVTRDLYEHLLKEPAA